MKNTSKGIKITITLRSTSLDISRALWYFQNLYQLVYLMDRLTNLLLIHQTNED